MFTKILKLRYLCSSASPTPQAITNLAFNAIKDPSKL